MNKLIITGVRGVPAAHGGFETFAENLALYLVARGWDVTVYCQEDAGEMQETFWRGVRRIHIPVHVGGAKATVIFDFLSIKHALSQPGLILTLGYNTAIFNIAFHVRGRRSVMNMDGLEWKRDKWSWYARAWLYLNERAGCLVSSHLVADHPEIKKHLSSRVDESKITMIPYGSRAVIAADEQLLEPFGLVGKRYALVIARPEPENSILEIVRSFSSKTRGVELVVLGVYDDSNSYLKSIRAAASEEVKFVGAVYEHPVLDALRYFSILYVHGHTVGGTNPSLIEALGAGQPVLAHDNEFNRWVARGGSGQFFADEHQCGILFDELFGNQRKLESMRKAGRSLHSENFQWDTILEKYEKVLVEWQ